MRFALALVLLIQGVAVGQEPLTDKNVDKILTGLEARGAVPRMRAYAKGRTEQDPPYVDLSLFTTLTDDAADELASKPSQLNLSGLTSLTDAQAKSLAKHRGCLYLGGLTTLTDDQVQALAKHRGFEDVGWLSLGLTALTDSQTKALAKHMGGSLTLNRLATLTDAQAEALAKHKGYLSLDGLTTLSAEAARTLRANPNISLPDKFKR